MRIAQDEGQVVAEDVAQAVAPAPQPTPTPRG